VTLDRDATTVIPDRNAVVVVDLNFDIVAEPGDHFVHAVVHYLEDEVVEALASGLSNIHSGTLSDCIQTLQDNDALGPVPLPGGRQNSLLLCFGQRVVLSILRGSGGCSKIPSDLPPDGTSIPQSY
jgi:hypothetical protein